MISSINERKIIFFVLRLRRNGNGKKKTNLIRSDSDNRKIQYSVNRFGKS